MNMHNLLGSNLKTGTYNFPSQINELLDGLAAAPDNLRFTHWLKLLAPPKNQLLDAELIKILQKKASQPDGLIRQTTPNRVRLLRKELRKRGLDGFIVPKADEHQGEYIAKRSERLWWLTGFSGSAGWAVVLSKKAAIFVDGRYTLQVKQEVNSDIFSHECLSKLSPAEWTTARIKTGARIGFDPWRMTPDQVNLWSSQLKIAGGTLVPEDYNPIDYIWLQQPSAPISLIFPYKTQYAGEISSKKKARLAKILQKQNLDAILLTQPDSICWLLNIRANDIPFSPLVLSFAIFYKNGKVDLFTDRRKLPSKTMQHLGKNVKILAVSSLQQSLEKLAKKSAKVQLDPGNVPFWIDSLLRSQGAAICNNTDPCQHLKACKNKVEVQGARIAHKRDGAILCTLFSWLNKTIKTKSVDEITIDTKLESLRSKEPQYRGPSFPAITGSGPNGAIVHYRVTPSTNRIMQNNELFLLDCGAQYLEGTTDVTRTVAIGKPSNEMCDRFTRVLKGHIALATALFPAGTTGPQLDVLARQHLWEVGLDFEHGTGHGVGSFLSVHEGPQRISKGTNSVELQPGMIISNEPGYYKKGEYGIRIENLILVVEKSPAKGRSLAMLGFETLTLAPIDRLLIKRKLMTSSEIDWLNNYHAKVLKIIGPRLKKSHKTWLELATKKLQ